jgi:hypothetical protein
MRYSVSGRGVGSCAEIARGMMNGREHIGDGDVEDVWEVGLDRRVWEEEQH